MTFVVVVVVVVCMKGWHHGIILRQETIDNTFDRLMCVSMCVLKYWRLFMARMMRATGSVNRRDLTNTDRSRTPPNQNRLSTKRRARRGRLIVAAAGRQGGNAMWLGGGRNGRIVPTSITAGSWRHCEATEINVHDSGGCRASVA